MYKPLAQRHSTALAITERLASLAREQTEAAFNTILAIMNNTDVDPGNRLKAAGMILDRGWGKAKEVLAIQQEMPQRRLIREIVHVTETREEFEGKDMIVEYDEIKNGNGSDKPN